MPSHISVLENARTVEPPAYSTHSVNACPASGYRGCRGNEQKQTAAIFALRPLRREHVALNVAARVVGTGSGGVPGNAFSGVLTQKCFLKYLYITILYQPYESYGLRKHVHWQPLPGHIPYVLDFRHGNLRLDAVTAAK